MRWRGSLMESHFSQEAFCRKRLCLLAHCHRVWSRNFVPLLLLILLQWPILLWGSYHRYRLTHLGVMALDSFLVIASCFYLVATMAAVSNRKLRQGILAFVLMCISILFFLEIFAIWQYGTLFGEGLMTVILETNPAEAMEYLQSVHGIWWLILGLLLSLPILCLYWKYRGIMLSRKILVLMQPEVIGAFLAALYIRPIGGEAPFDLPLTQITSAVIQTREDMEHYEELRQNMSGEVSILRNESRIPYVVLILGESTQRNLMHLYGYSLPNTPRLDALAEKGELVVYGDVISAKQGTVLSLREMFTFHDVESGREWYQCSNLLDILREAGYETWWLSNQDSFGVWANTGTLFANRADYAVFTQKRASQDDFGIHDEALLPLLDKAFADDGSDRNFYVLHLMGCHVLYELRYPEEFERFTAKEIAGNLPSDWKEDIAAYANAVFYNDFVVSSIIERFRGKDAVVIYISDHGENVHDEGSDLLGHAYGEPNRYLYEIPFMVWASNTFRQNHPEKWSAIQGAVSRSFMTDDLIHALLGLLDIQTVEYDPRKNIFAPEFDTGRKRIVSGRDYDTELRHLKIDEQ